MKTSRVLALAAALMAGVSAPAFAAFDKIGSIDVGYHPDRDSASPDFGGPVERLQFIARGTDVQCAYIRATFGNGQTAQLFSGRLAQGAPRAVDLPGAQRNIRRITVNCHGFQKGGSSIDLYADVGSYRDTWRKSPNWASVWARIFTTWGPVPGPGGPMGGPIGQPAGFWAPVTTVQFVGPVDRTGGGTGWGARNISAIALKPLDADARCSSVNATFGDGSRANLSPRTLMSRGQNYPLDLPGGKRNIASLSMKCHAMNARAVSIQVLGRK
ncbi:MAG TPA: hypothetical protein VGG10_07460 [Rhizomicrobium sp.]